GRKPSRCTCLAMTRVYNKPDRISFLPDFIINQILSNLSIKEAGRTSVLSSNWRKKWSTQPVLVFDNQCVSGATFQDPSVIERKFVSIIDHVLLLHSGPINKFEVSDPDCDLIGVNSVAHIDRWILHLIGRSIKELVLDIWFKQRYKIPWCLFSCQSLRHLNLYSCLLKPPMTFKGFRNLKILVLEWVTMDQDAFEHLISGSPLLEELTLGYFDGFTQINIRAPNLKLIRIIVFGSRKCASRATYTLYQSKIS
ncbi:F-box/FBD/LRR-repeat protein, partial [Trifolium medium]|nr:F-box/FBD/LRR-repeat protein [Trifolium medium]